MCKWCTASGNLSRLRDTDIGAIMRCIDDYVYKWKDISAELGFTPAQLTQIESMPLLVTGAPRSWMEMMLGQWI